MDESFKIYVEQLRDGKTEDIAEDYSPDFIGVNEQELQFTKTVKVRGEAYLADDNLLLHLNITAYAIVPCAICNEPVEVEIKIDNYYYSEPLAEIKGAVYDFSNLLRETILLEVPRFAECNEGRCSRRADIAKYLKEASKNNKNNDGDEGYQPFADINLDKFKPTK